MVFLKNGHEVEDARLDRIYELDYRSLDYPVTSVLKDNLDIRNYKPRSYTWRCDNWLDQGREGSCVGHGFAHDLVARPQEVRGIRGPFSPAAQYIYYEAQKRDVWPGGSYKGADPFYEGTSVLAGAKVVKELEYYDGYHWALNINQLGIALGYLGPCILGCNWHAGMWNTDADGYIHPTGGIVGGHCLLIMAIKIHYKKFSWLGWWKRTWDDVDLDKSYVTLHNSWGPAWGEDGRAKLSLTDLDRLLNENGDACFPIRNTKRDWTATEH